MTHDEFMRRAIELSRIHMHDGAGGPFGAVVVKDGRIVGEGWNQVTSTNDPTAHAEIVAIRAAARTLGTFALEGCTIYSSCEPCPMCLGAILWGRCDALYYANSRAEAAAIGFDDAAFYQEVAAPPHARTLPSRRHLPEEAREVFQEWTKKPDKIRY